MRALIIEDNITIACHIQSGLSKAGHDAEVALNGVEGLEQALSHRFDVIILDLMLPGMGGSAVLAALREQSQVPVLILSAKDQVDEKVAGLRAGANDYLTKPFAFEELLARAEGLAGRTHSDTTVLRAGDLTMDLITRRVCRGGIEIDLQAKEFQLLECLLRNQGKVVTRSMLLEHVWNYHFDPQTNVIDVHISRLRQKVDRGFAVPLIETVRGTGYRIMDTHS